MSNIPLDSDKAYAEVDLAFRRDEVRGVNEETLERYMAVLCEHGVKNPDLKHREIIRGLLIQHIQMRRVITALDMENKKTQRLFLIVAIGSMLFTALGVSIMLLLP